eukprot:jgi/Ulvmu1/4967/UM207_0011.1
MAQLSGAYFCQRKQKTHNNTIKAATTEFPDVRQLVQADAKANRVSIKGSLARNLHRLRTVLLFVEKLMQNLSAAPDVTLSSAASEAYAVSLGPYHSTVMRATCNAGLLLLPTRVSFLRSIGETEDSGLQSVKAVCPAAMALIECIDKLYDKPMPASTNWF